MKKILLTVQITFLSFLTFSQCPGGITNAEVYLTNIAFVDRELLNVYSQPFFNTIYDGGFDGSYVIIDDQGNPVNILPATMNKNPLNPANLIDVGKPIRFKFQVQNRRQNGLSIVSGSCKVRTTDPRIILTDSTAGLNNVGWNASAWSSNEFEFKIADTVTQSFTAYLDIIVIENGIEYKTSCIPIPINALSVSSKIDDDDDNPDSNGDSDGIIEQNETIETLIKIKNVSNFNANYVEGSLLKFTGTDWIYNIYDSIAIWSFGQQGLSGPVYPTSWYNYFQGQPSPVPSGAVDVQSEYDFVFDYNYSSTYSFELPLTLGTGFYIFGNNYPPVLMFSSAMVRYNNNFPPVPTNATITSLNCSNASSTGVLTNGVSATGATFSVPYLGGNGGAYNGQSIPSSGVTGLTANLNAGVLSTSSGNFTYTISGTPSSSGLASFDINVGGQNCITNLTVEQFVGINEIDNDLQLFPNPTQNIFTINNKNSSKTTISVRDIQGRTIIRPTTFFNELNVSTIDWQIGYYLVEIIDESGITKHIKLHKQ